MTLPHDVSENLPDNIAVFVVVTYQTPDLQHYDFFPFQKLNGLFQLLPEKVTAKANFLEHCF